MGAWRLRMGRTNLIREVEHDSRGVVRPGGVLLMPFDVDRTELILTVMAAVNTFFGTVLGISNYQYKNQ